MIEIKLPNGVKALGADLTGVQAVFRGVEGSKIEYHAGLTNMGIAAYFGNMARRLFNLDVCAHCGTWSKVKSNCGNCLRAELDIAQYNLKQERSKFELEEKNLAAANERIAGLETLHKTAVTNSISHTDVCGCEWRIAATSQLGYVTMGKTRVKSCYAHNHVYLMGIRFYPSVSYTPWFVGTL